MLVTGLVLAGVAAAIHVYIFVMESLTWTSDRTRATFGTSRAEAEATRELAFNQGFYNLFLAVLVVLGIVLHAAGWTTAGVTLVLAGAGSMVAAGLVLLVSSPSKARAALVQLVPPLLGVLGVVLGLVL
jgi:putative membrane protein